jgi:AraC-like DNA-binding protein
MNRSLQTAAASQGHVLAAVCCGIDRFIRAEGADPDRVLGKAGVDDRVLADPMAAVSLASFVEMMEGGASETGNGHFGLLFGQQFQPLSLGLIGELALSAPDAGAGLAAFAKLFPLHQQNTETRLVAEAGMLRLEYRILDARIWARRQDAELTMGMFANVARQVLGSAYALEEVCFEHPRPEQSRLHERLFGAPVFFAARTNAITFRAGGLERALPGADARRFMAIAARLREIGRAPAALTVEAQVCGEIRRLLPDGYPPIETVAETLGLARWTMQRRLAEHGVSFSDCVEHVRARLALLYLTQPHLNVGAISDLLGYSEISALSRAFRRWYGAPPETMRREMMKADG